MRNSARTLFLTTGVGLMFAAAIFTTTATKAHAQNVELDNATGTESVEAATQQIFNGFERNRGNGNNGNGNGNGNNGNGNGNNGNGNGNNGNGNGHGHGYGGGHNFPPRIPPALRDVLPQLFDVFAQLLRIFGR